MTDYIHIRREILDRLPYEDRYREAGKIIGQAKAAAAAYQDEVVAEMIASGMNGAEVGRLLGMSTARVSARLKNHRLRNTPPPAEKYPADGCGICGRPEAAHGMDATVDDWDDPADDWLEDQPDLGHDFKKPTPEQVQGRQCTKDQGTIDRILKEHPVTEYRAVLSGNPEQDAEDEVGSSSALDHVRGALFATHHQPAQENTG